MQSIKEKLIASKNENKQLHQEVELSKRLNRNQEKRSKFSKILNSLEWMK